MPAQMPRCTDCGTTLKSVPPWLATASVRFTCNSCPRRSVRPAAAVARFEAPLDAALPVLAEPGAIVDADDTDEMTEDGEDLELEAIAEGPDEAITEEPITDDKDV